MKATTRTAILIFSAVPLLAAVSTSYAGRELRPVLVESGPVHLTLATTAVVAPVAAVPIATASPVVTTTPVAATPLATTTALLAMPVVAPFVAPVLITAPTLTPPTPSDDPPIIFPGNPIIFPGNPISFP